MQMKKWSAWVGVCAVAIMAALFTLSGLSDFELDNANVSTLRFSSGQNVLSGSLIAPQGVTSPPVVLIVHGDGAQDRFSDSGYLPLINQLIDAGIGVFTWDKPGVGESSGEWLEQSMQDRADEAVAALNAVRAQPGMERRKIGFLGFSQAGWVIPPAARQSQPAFSVIVGGALNWREQGAYYTRQKLARAGMADAEIERQVSAELAANDVVFGQPELADPSRRPDIEPKRFAFIARNYLADATQSVSIMPGPVLALWGSDDLNVDPQQNAKRYQQLLTACLDQQAVIVPEATHGLLRAQLFNDQLTTAWPQWKRGAFIVLGRKAYAPGAIQQMTEWITAEAGKNASPE
ncbi:alpha/beta hydrolase family protein [Pectobacterium aroidearum]|uniref:alpha/beta hydrolase family protein n=1 Tax=Pectobacterium aroidearum TaxID=1201031 RepID=UPI002114B881|nr:alpha/beta fold hydrolase [Pectobacterium aroidearum]UUE37565.1 lysophospholipase [Pectobacterium aroidearum]UUE41942.1 lysophospholipase [Pectobacterium aroidearum]